MSAEVSGEILKGFLFDFLDRPKMQFEQGNGRLYRMGILDCIAELTGEDQADILEEVRARWHLDQGTMSAIIKRWRQGVSHEDLIEEFGITPGQMGQLGFGN